MNTITLTIAATPDNLRRLAEAFGSGIDAFIGADDIPAKSCPAGMTEAQGIDINPAKIEPPFPETEPKAPETVENAPKKADSVQETTPKEPESTKTVTMSDLRARGLELSKNGHRQELKALLDEYGVPRVAELPEEHYAEFYARLEEIK